MFTLLFFILEHLKAGLSVSERHDVLVVVCKLLLEQVTVVDGSCERYFELFCFQLEVLHCDLVGLNLVADVDQFLSGHPDEFEVLSRDVVVVLLHLAECLLVVFHEVINVLVFSLLDLVALHFQSKVQFFLQVLELLLVLIDQALSSEVEVFLELEQVAIQLLLGVVDVSLVLEIVTRVVVLELALVLEHFFVPVGVEDSLLFHHFLGINFNTVAVVAVLVLEMLDFLHKDFNLSAVGLLHGLHVGVEVFDAGVELLDFSSGVVVEVVDHVLFHLKHVTLELGVVELLVEVLDVLVQLGASHGHVNVVGLNVLLPLLSLALLAFFSSHC